MWPKWGIARSRMKVSGSVKGLDMKLGCIVMASGAGRRFRDAGGTAPKLLEPFDGPFGRMPLVVQTAASVPRDRFDVAVVTWLPEVAGAVARSDVPVEVVRQTVEVQPPRSVTVRAGALHAEAQGWDGALFLPGDQPLVSRESFHALADAFEADPTCAYRLGWHGEPASPVLFPARAFSALMGLRGRDGGSSVLRDGAFDVGFVEARRACELFDVDVPADLTRIARIASAIFNSSQRR